MGSDSPCGFDRTSVCERYRPLVESTVKRLDIVRGMREDAKQEGMIGLLNAFDRFNPDRNVDFSVFARPYVRGAIMRGIFPKMPEIKVTPVGGLKELYDLDAGRGHNREGGEPLGDPDPEAELIERMLLHAWLDSLAPKDGWLIWRRFYQGASSAEVATELDATPHWVNERQRTLVERGRTILMAA